MADAAFATDLLDAASPAGALVYLAGNLGLTAWSRRTWFRQGGRPALVAALDVLGNASLSIPALAYWNAGIMVRVGDGLMRVLFVLGAAALLAFTRQDAHAMLRDPRLDTRQRRKFAALAIAAALLPSIPELWWGASALAHVYAS